MDLETWEIVGENSTFLCESPVIQCSTMQSIVAVFVT
jgi:hypothetical protein